MAGAEAVGWARRLRLALAALLALGYLAVLPTPQVRAASCEVVNTNDAGPDSFRAALGNTDGFANCDTITFALPGNGPWTITLASALPPIARDLTITGLGRDLLTIDGNDAVRPFLILGGTVTIERLTIAQGYAASDGGGCVGILLATVTLRELRVRDCVAERGGGGVMISAGALTIERTELRNNRAASTGGGGGGAIFATQYYGDATLTVRESVIAGNQATTSFDGGGIHAWRQLDRPSSANPYALTVLIERSTFGGLNPADANTARLGGGFMNESAAATLTAVTFIGNSATEGGGGLFNWRGTLELTNATVSGNTIPDPPAGFSTAGGGVANVRGMATLTNVTITGNSTTGSTGAGGGLYNSGTTPSPNEPGHTNLRGSIVAGNASATGADCYNVAATGNTWTSQGYNVVGKATGCPTGGTDDLVHAGTLATLLSPLADNGGPTQTHALPTNSPALDRLPPAQCGIASDQRGIGRPRGPGCDSGAYELRYPALTVATNGGGNVTRTPAGSGDGPFEYAPGTPVELTPQPGAGQTFIGWLVDGIYRGWSSPLTLTMEADHIVQATFAPTNAFDVPAQHPAYTAIVALAARGTIRGYSASKFGADDGVQRAQMAALIARATSAGPDNPPTTLVPPACLVVGTWDCEDWGTAFSDQSGDPNLWRNAGTLQHYGVALGYTQSDCTAKGRAFPCYGPSDPISYAQTITFITRMMKVKGYWVAQPNAPLPYANVPGPHQEDVRIFAFYTGGVPAPPSDWNAGATRGWFAQALWQALNGYWGTDGNLADGQPAGGFVP